MHIPNNKIDNAEDAQDDQNNKDNQDDHLRWLMTFQASVATLQPWDNVSNLSERGEENN